MARGLDIAGGIGYGISRGIEDLERMDRHKYDQDQRKRTQKKQDEEDALERDLAAVKPSGKYREMLEGPAGTEGGVEVPTDVDRSEADYTRDVAGVYAKRGKVRESIAARGTARQLDREKRTDDINARRDAVAAKYRPQFEALTSGKHEDAMGVLSAAVKNFNSGNVPDGHTAYEASTPEGVKITIVNDKTNKVTKTHLITKENARETAAAALQVSMLHEMGAISTEDFMKSFEKGIDLEKLGLLKRKAATEETQAANDAKRAQTADDIARSTIEMNLAHGRLYDSQRKRLEAAKKEGNPFKLAVVRRGKESVPVTFRMVERPDGNGAVPQAYDMTGKPISDPKELSSLFSQPSTEDPFEVALMDAAKKSGSTDEVVKAEQTIRAHRDRKALSTDKSEWAAVPAEGKDEAYAELVAKGAKPEYIKEVTGGYKPKKKAAAKEEPKPTGVGIGREVMTRYRQPTAEEKMSSMTHK